MYYRENHNECGCRYWARVWGGRLREVDYHQHHPRCQGRKLVFNNLVIWNKVGL